LPFGFAAGFAFFAAGELLADVLVEFLADAPRRVKSTLRSYPYTLASRESERSEGR